MNGGTNLSADKDRWIKLNVGGEYFLTTRSTLMKEQNSFLARLIHDDTDLESDKDSTGAYLVDRDPKYFRVVLNYLRHGKLVIDGQLSVEGVLEEADFYGITGLITLAKKRNEDRGGCTLCGRAHHPVYRIFQCSEEELASMVSAISDGWKFEQIVSTGSSYNYGNSDENGSEFLCVVSRECTVRHTDKTTSDHNVPSDDSTLTDRTSLLIHRGFHS